MVASRATQLFQDDQGFPPGSACGGQVPGSVAGIPEFGQREPLGGSVGELPEGVCRLPIARYCLHRMSHVLVNKAEAVPCVGFGCLVAEFLAEVQCLATAAKRLRVILPQGVEPPDGVESLRLTDAMLR